MRAVSTDREPGAVIAGSLPMMIDGMEFRTCRNLLARAAHALGKQIETADDSTHFAKLLPLVGRLEAAMKRVSGDREERKGPRPLPAGTPPIAKRGLDWEPGSAFLEELVEAHI